MRKFLLLLSVPLLLGIIHANAQVTVGATPYTTLKGAFDAINAGTHTGAVVISINGNTTETASAVLNASGTGSASYTSVVIRPTTSAVVSGDIAAPLIDLSGASNVTIDGRIGGSGTTKSLTLRNVSVSNTIGTSTVRFQNGVSADVLTYCFVEGSSTVFTLSTAASSTATIIIGGSSGASGNSNITISNNDIRAAGSNLPFCAILSSGQSATVLNSGVTISNNNIYDFWNPGGHSSGIYAEQNGTGFTISGNSLYQTGARTSTAASIQYIMLVADGGDNHQITGNFIGGSAAGATGTAYTIAGGFSNFLVGIGTFTGTTVISGLNGNTITNINHTSTPSSNGFAFVAIRALGGGLNIGTVSGNTVGAATGNGAITLNLAGANANFSEGIILGGTGGQYNVSNNTIGSITINGAVSGTVNFRGIEGSNNAALTVQNNTIGGTTANSIQCNTATSSMLSILSFPGANSNNTSQTFTGNTINNWTNNSTGASAAITGLQAQITASSTQVAFTITNNQFKNLNTTSALATNGSISSVVITQSSSLTSVTSDANISNNVFSNQTAASTGASTSIRAITNANAFTNFLTIKSNQIYAFSSAGTTTANTSSVAVQGIASTSSGAGVLDISQNQIYNLESTASIATYVAGIASFYGGTTGSISRNQIYDLRAPNGSSTAVVAGIVIRGASSAGTTNVFNNMISLSPANVQVYGIHNNSLATQLNLYYNTVYIGGTGTGSNVSSAFFRNAVATPVDIRSNIFYNVRTGGGGNYAIVNTNATPATGWTTSNYNDLYAATGANTVLWGSTAMDFATYKTTSGTDANSKAITVTFANAANGDLHVSGASNGDNNLIATAIPGITTDYDGTTRRSWAPYMGADEGTTLLSVQLITFTGARDGQINKLVWSTSSETNNKGFDLERSVDGKNYTAIAFIGTKADKGNSTISLNYSFTDEKAVTGTFYYRLKQVDNDGKFSYSNVVVLKGEKRFDIASVYPNPSKDQINLAINSEINSKGTISVIDMQGRIMKQVAVALNAGDNIIHLDVSVLATGTYMIRLANDRMEVQSAQFIKN